MSATGSARSRAKTSPSNTRSGRVASEPDCVDDVTTEPISERPSWGSKFVKLVVASVLSIDGIELFSRTTSHGIGSCCGDKTEACLTFKLPLFIPLVTSQLLV